MLSYDFKGIFKCFEIKSSKQDFYSDAKHTFIGHYNYYFMPLELFEEVKNDIPKWVGCYCPNNSWTELVSHSKASKKDVPNGNLELLKNSMIRSLYREASKYITDDRDKKIKELNSKIRKIEKEDTKYYKYYIRLQNDITEIRREITRRYGREVWEEIEDMIDR